MLGCREGSRARRERGGEWSVDRESADGRGGSTVRKRERKAVLLCSAIMVTAPASFPGLPHLKILIV